ncbi:tellurium resistance protein TerA [Roseospira marina]|uniref:Tellurium resistance protein TerA n=1 Tax=Roseospira marina TaxID=140057 RepID=A0A5M6IC51_9PROT|nr:TerD family protein [Roseospira marina]KAA5605860.1 tellurium resistance protein TerA [Roseospira marina]MBB4313679.1 tellurite resistance protein TerA [Roseospira marina]MBB5086841.1 tellurite resistance protein TerA [Roseospira marina]
MTLLTLGANAPVPAGDLSVLIRHGSLSGAEIDVSAFLVTSAEKVRSDADMCFYGQPSVADGAVTLAGSGNGETRFAVAPSRIPAGVEKVIFTATIHENRATFGQLADIGVDVSGVQGQIPCAGMTETALILAELYLRNGAWKVRIVGQGFNGGLPALATHLGVEIADPAPAPASPPASTAPTPAPNTVNLSKVSLTKQNNAVNLKKDDGRFGKVRINLNWNQKTKKKGFFSRGSSGIDLDVGAFIETHDGKRDVVQALGNAFGDFSRPPYVKLLGDDRTGAVSDGEWLEINGDKWSEIKRVLVYAFIYEGVPNWQETDGVIRILVPGQPEIEVRMNEFGDRRAMCAVARLENDGGQVRVTREVTFHTGQRDMDEAYGWGFRWSAGRK